jgi:translation initiation factor 4E
LVALLVPCVAVVGVGGGAGEERTVSVDITPNQRPGLTMKHPLGSAWTLWFYSNDRSRSWKDNQREVTTVSTVEDFWALYHHIEVASAIPNGSDYSLFREGIFPCWDDTRNQKGGRWMVTVDKRQRAKCLDSYWMEILLFLIGEQADGDLGQVNGAVVNVRPKGDKLAVWLADSGEQDSVLRVGKLIKGVVGMEFNQMLDYLMHDENKQKLYGKIQV